MKGLLSFFKPTFARTVVYMLQSVEYQPLPYLSWFWRTTDFGTVMKRRSLEMTKPAKLLLLAMYGGLGAHILAAFVFIILWRNGLSGGLYFASATLLIYPILWGNLIVLPLIIGRIVIIAPKERALIAASRQIFANHKGTKIAIAGSYGKTTMKELLLTVLSAGKKVAATPGNKNVAISHAYFARKLSGDEDVVIVEFGEGKPGDVAAFTATFQPDIAVITGIAPAHLDHYANLDAAAKDIFSVATTLDAKMVYVNNDSKMAQPYIEPTYNTYNRHGALGWEVSDIKVDYTGTAFELKKGKRVLKLKSGLLGAHNVGALAFAAALADKLGLSSEQIIEGISRTEPYEHRMSLREVNGAYILDDSYNGNIDGIAAGIELLKTLPAERKTYVTPGLVDQGVETIAVHERIGHMLRDAGFNKIILMRNSVTDHILNGLNSNKTYNGEVLIEDDPLRFYTHLDDIVASGDTVMLQNDWTDNYR